MNSVEIATAVVTLFWIMLLTAHTILLHKRTDEIEKQAEADRKKLNVVEANAGMAKGAAEGLGYRLTRVQNDMDDIAQEPNNSDRRTIEAMKQHKEALRELYEYAQKAGKIRSDMLQKITDLECWVQAHEMRHIEQEEKQWKD